MSQRDVRVRRRLVGLVAVAALSACMGSSNDPSLEWAAFEETECPESSNAATCFTLRAEAGGTRPGDGRCDVFAVDADGTKFGRGATFGPVTLAPGRTFEWLVELPDVDDASFEEWIPECVSRRAG